MSQPSTCVPGACRGGASQRVVSSLAVAAASLFSACGGSDPASAETVASATSNKVEVVTTCIDPTPAVTSNVTFVAPTAAATGVVLSDNRTSACFDGTAAVGVHASVAVTPGADSFYYFEARRSTPWNLGIGVSGTAPEKPANGGSEFVPTRDGIHAIGGISLTADWQGAYLWGTVGTAEVLGFAVDVREKYPVVYILGPASGNPGACPGVAASDLCVLSRAQLEGSTGKVWIHAWGIGGGTPGSGPKVSINTGNKLTTKPFTYTSSLVRAALRTHWYQGDRGLNAQWPGSRGPASSVAADAVGHTHVVVREGDAAPYRTSIKVQTGRRNTVRWSDERGTALGSGATLPVNAALVAALGPGEHRVAATVASASSGRDTEVAYRFTVLASPMNSDDDGDGLSYDQEKSRGLDPANPDTDGDGLSDGAEQALGFDAARADSDGDGVVDGLELTPAAVNRRVFLAAETGAFATNRGVVLSGDGTQAAFTTDLNQDCMQGIAPFDANYRALEYCHKRAVRANEGVRQGEFRYFETRRLGPPENLGHGILLGQSRIDPYCCFDSGVQPTPPNPITPPSMGLNSVGGVFVQLVLVPQFSHYPDYDPAQTVVQGFAVDYRGVDPVVYVVMTDGAGAMTISLPMPVPGFAGAQALPMLYGHPNLNNAPRSAVNLGLGRFHYDVEAIRSVLASRGVNVVTFAPGVGIHRWK